MASRAFVPGFAREVAITTSEANLGTCRGLRLVVETAGDLVVKYRYSDDEITLHFPETGLIVEAGEFKTAKYPGSGAVALRGDVLHILV